MSNLIKTNRTFTDIETNKIFSLYQDSDTKNFKLIYDNSDVQKSNDLANGTTVNGWYLSAHTGVTIKLNNKKEVVIPSGYFYNFKENEKATHKKYTGLQKRFTKI